jgi:hypothetical protein
MHFSCTSENAGHMKTSDTRLILSIASKINRKKETFMASIKFMKTVSGVISKP